MEKKAKNVTDEEQNKEYYRVFDLYVKKFNEAPPPFGYDSEISMEEYISGLKKSIKDGEKFKIKYIKPPKGAID